MNSESQPTVLGPDADTHLVGLASLLSTLDTVAPSSRSSSDPINQLVQVRLGLASALFSALRLRHGPTADHSLRVALICSQWAQLTEMSGDARDELEVAALLHDIGKIGVPDPVLKKPSALSPEQAVAMRQATPHGMRILSECCVSAGILDIIQHVHTWYNCQESNVNGRDLPLGARMIAIVDAFDAMTTDRVYRKAMPRERAVAELFEQSGTQFDPELVAQFATLHGSHGNTFFSEPARQWLHELDAVATNRFWGLQSAKRSQGIRCSPEGFFFEAFLAGARDAVIFIDGHLNIVRWNQGAESLTGIAAEQIVDCCWHPKLVGLKDRSGLAVPEEACPITRAVISKSSMVQLVNITNRQGDMIPVDAAAIPVTNEHSEAMGSVIVFHDKTTEQSWREQIESLHDRVTRDPLTGVANRAEFDRFHEQAVASHISKGSPCSLVICDIDRFKRVNDELGHQAGDTALVTFAKLLTQCCREGDLVARYGGEEFVIVCNDCGSAEAAQLAEKIRATLEATKLAELGGRSITASFGVTELQPGDDAETMLRRADRGLLQAKDNGRNRVIELGTGMQGSPVSSQKPKRWWQSWGSARSPQRTIEAMLSTNVPMNLVAQKLHGFISDQDAQVMSVQPERIEMQVTSGIDSQCRRSSDRPVTFHVELCFDEAHEDNDRTRQALTLINVRMSPLRVRDRRQNPTKVADHLLSSLRSYLMAQNYVAETG